MPREVDTNVLESIAISHSLNALTVTASAGLEFFGRPRRK
jgi:hypothetical protein